VTSTEATAAGSNSSGIWNLPNILTMLRIVLVPFFVWFLIADAPGLHSQASGWRWAAVAAFAVAIYTDKLDGDIARSRGLVTDFGKIADPIADKLLTGSALVMLSLLNELPWWITLVILVREWGITALRFFVIRYGVIPASRGGKLKTVVQTVAIFLYLLPLAAIAPWLTWVAFGVMLAAVLITVWTGAEYVVQALKVRSEGLRLRAQDVSNQDNAGQDDRNQDSLDQDNTGQEGQL
jgi:CDP-diacylglycerol--glycerol-3-phosphate 3-phosphatidyltransferase/cardiolipin synthase